MAGCSLAPGWPPSAAAGQPVARGCICRAGGARPSTGAVAASCGGGGGGGRHREGVRLLPSTPLGCWSQVCRQAWMSWADSAGHSGFDGAGKAGVASAGLPNRGVTAFKFKFKLKLMSSVMSTPGREPVHPPRPAPACDQIASLVASDRSWLGLLGCALIAASHPAKVRVRCVRGISASVVVAVAGACGMTAVLSPCAPGASPGHPLRCRSVCCNCVACCPSPLCAMTWPPGPSVTTVQPV